MGLEPGTKFKGRKNTYIPSVNREKGERVGFNNILACSAHHEPDEHSGGMKLLKLFCQTRFMEKEGRGAHRLVLDCKRRWWWGGEG